MEKVIGIAMVSDGPRRSGVECISGKEAGDQGLWRHPGASHGTRASTLRNIWLYHGPKLSPLRSCLVAPGRPVDHPLIIPATICKNNS